MTIPGLKLIVLSERAGLSWRNATMKAGFFAAIVRKMEPMERNLSKELVLKSVALSMLKINHQ